MADLHVLEDDMAEDADWRRDVSGVEQYLAKHLAFARFCDERDTKPRS